MEEDLPAEVNRLRAENEYLKKLQALVPEGERRQRKEAGYYHLILKPVKKLDKLFIAPKVRQVLYETPQRVFTRCACAQRTGFLIKYFNQESV